MKELYRQTGFSLQELLNLLGSDDNQYPPCLLMNEIGTIFCQGEDQDETAENYLLSVLNDADGNKRAITCYYLSYDKDAASKHSTVLAEFRLKPENELLLPIIDEALNGAEQF